VWYPGERKLGVGIPGGKWAAKIRLAARWRCLEILKQRVTVFERQATIHANISGDFG
jgi:hypothetical protein